MADKTSILSDIAALARAGYKVSEVKELLTLSKQTESEPDKPDPTQGKDPVQPDPEKGKAPEPVKDDEKDKPAEPEVDARDAEIKELQTQIKKLQEQNASRDISGSQPDTTKQLNDLVASFM